MRLGKFRHNQTGDTIVEVLIAIAVSSAVLGSSYAIVNRAVNSSQQANEHSLALKLAEEQLERLRSAPNKARAFDSSLTRSFCMPADLTQGPQENPGISLTSTSLPVTSASYTTACRISDGGATDRYLIGITRIGDVFKVYVSWNGATGRADLVNLVYKVYP
jgi:Tfp pilus assembly protein PilV